MQICLV